MAERLRALSLNHLIISPLCLVWVRAPHWPRETSQVLFARWFFLGFSRFRPPTDWPVSYERNNLERDVKLNKKKNKNKECYLGITPWLLVPIYALYFLPYHQITSMFTKQKMLESPYFLGNNFEGFSYLLQL